MNTYLVVKTLHILSATLMVGTGFGTAFYLFWANRSGSVPAQAVVSKWVIKADWWFTTPAVIFQPLSGWWMMSQAQPRCPGSIGVTRGCGSFWAIPPSAPRWRFTF